MRAVGYPSKIDRLLKILESLENEKILFRPYGQVQFDCEVLKMYLALFVRKWGFLVTEDGRYVVNNDAQIQTLSFQFASNIQMLR